MHLEIPKFTRCCGCLPLRRGIIVLGYLSLALAIYFLTLEFYYDETVMDHLYRGAIFFAHKWLVVILYFIEIVFIIVLLVGAHTERHELMRVYFYYGVTTTAAALATYLLVSLSSTIPSHWSFFLTDLCLIFSGIATQGYLLLLIRSELEKPRETLRYVNQLAEVSVQPPCHGLSLL